MPSWKDIDKFLNHDGWTFAPENSGTDKFYYKILPDGKRWVARVSRGSSEVGKNKFSEILKKQLRCSKSYFNKVLASKKNSTDEIESRML